MSERSDGERANVADAILEVVDDDTDDSSNPIAAARRHICRDTGLAL